jgi:UDP-glucose 4-epimerase
MKILVCGGAGYIGSNMTAMLAAKGHEPIVYDSLKTGHKTAVQNVPVVVDNLANTSKLIETIKKYQIEAVMHFAASIEAGESVLKPLKYFTNNVQNTLNLLQAMESQNVKKLVFSSTAAVYGTPQKIPLTENAPKIPINPYGETKLTSEKMCHWQSKTGKLNYAALRYFNAAGAGNNNTLGEDHRPESHLIPLTIQAAMSKRDDIKIFGTDYDTPDGTCIRDYIHIEDLCSAHLLALEKLEENSELSYNLGNGKGYSVRQVIDTVKKVSGKDFKVIETERRPGDPPILTADSTKAQKELGWKTKHPDLETIIETAWKWHSQNPDGYPD